jgi:RNA polymerase sigma-70 factor (ECF subfamily)
MEAFPETPESIDRDAELMLKVGQGDIASFTLLLNRHRPAVLYFIYRKVKNAALAEELSQEVFLRVYRARASYQAKAKFKTWLFRIATNLALNALRDSRKDAWQKRLSDISAGGRPLQVSDNRPTAEERLVHETKFAEVRRAIAELPELQRSAVVMQRYREMDYGEIAAALGCSESAVKSLLFRAHEALRHRLVCLTPMEATAQSDLLERIAS